MKTATTELFRTLKSVRVQRLRSADAELMIVGQPESGRAIRLYCERSGARSDASWALQVRAPIGIGFSGSRDGKDFAIAHASLSRDELTALRDAINAQLGEE